MLDELHKSFYKLKDKQVCEYKVIRQFWMPACANQISVSIQNRRLSKISLKEKSQPCAAYFIKQDYPLGYWITHVSLIH